ncbi:DUF1801 domain-containing protein [Gracilimonas amylolytica]|uniref:DUF1801 domain-containing protein n=1 Tax=Gracilimonas amylolytica TaxID=1749045 RepID=UPI000CD898E5|nr:DUF1801 domain-containing protein [Gracilimonas amylolytica]
MAELKTKQNEMDVSEHLNAIEDPQRKEDCIKIHDLMADITGEDANMWGDSIVGFGSYHYKYDSGREGDWFITGFANRKQQISLYIMSGFKRYDELMAKLGKHKTGKSCLYIKKLSDIDMEVLETLIRSSVEYMNKTYNQ